jgi:hypothetical protein
MIQVSDLGFYHLSQKPKLIGCGKFSHLYSDICVIWRHIVLGSSISFICEVVSLSVMFVAANSV